MTGMTYFQNCVGWVPSDVHAEGGLCDMIRNDRQVTRETFCRHVDRAAREDIERALGYEVPHRAGYLSMCNDFHVSYHRSTLHGRTVYFFKHSAIEYVFSN